MVWPRSSCVAEPQRRMAEARGRATLPSRGVATAMAPHGRATEAYKRTPLLQAALAEPHAATRGRAHSLACTTAAPWHGHMRLLMLALPHTNFATSASAHRFFFCWRLQGSAVSDALRASALIWGACSPRSLAGVCRACSREPAKAARHHAFPA